MTDSASGVILQNSEHGDENERLHSTDCCTNIVIGNIKHIYVNTYPLEQGISSPELIDYDAIENF